MPYVVPRAAIRKSPREERQKPELGLAFITNSSLDGQNEPLARTETRSSDGTLDRDETELGRQHGTEKGADEFEAKR